MYAQTCTLCIDNALHRHPPSVTGTQSGFYIPLWPCTFPRTVSVGGPDEPHAAAADAPSTPVTRKPTLHAHT